jgi:hypothetical protein
MTRVERAGSGRRSVLHGDESIYRQLKLAISESRTESQQMRRERDAQTSAIKGEKREEKGQSPLQLR